MKGFILIVHLALISFCLKGQSNSDSLKHLASDSNLIQDKRVNELVLKHVLINEAKKEKIRGYRVQLHFGPEKTKALDVKTKFSTQFQDTPVYLNYEQPYFKIRAGDCRTKLEAYKLLQNISGDFPGAFIVSDDIELPKIN